jgi:hypothetical protein
MCGVSRKTTNERAGSSRGSAIRYFEGTVFRAGRDRWQSGPGQETVSDGWMSRRNLGRLLLGARVREREERISASSATSTITNAHVRRTRRAA